MAHKAEVCTIDFKHVVELLGLGFGPFAALDCGMSCGFVDMFVGFVLWKLFILWQ